MTAAGDTTAAWQPYAAVRETHSAVIVLMGELALKVKKPVDLGFLDFSTREKRLRVCQHEVELNRRLAPDVYLGVADVHGPDQTLAEHLIVMRRMPEDRRLSTLVLDGASVLDELETIARILAAFHQQARRGAEVSAQGTRDAWVSRWNANLAGMEPFAGTVLDAAVLTEIRDLATGFLAGRRALFDERVLNGAVLDGHGDLLADDIFCLSDGPRILDCLEFDDTLRYVDGVDDACFLAMDLERLGALDAAEHFLASYLTAIGDTPPRSLIDHYVAYRATVRSKVACLRAAQGLPGATALAGRLLEQAGAHLRAGRVRLALVGGEPGTGKSTVATQLAQARGAVVLSSDRVRKELAGVAPETSMAAALGAGIYSAERTGQTYAEMMARAETYLSHGVSVVLDATWSDPAERAAAAAVAERTTSEVLSLRCSLDASIAAQRIAARHGDASDADPVIAAAIRSRFAPWPEAQLVDTSATPAECLKLVTSSWDQLSS